MLPYHKMIRMFLEIIKKPFILFKYLFFLAPLLSGSAFPLVLGLMRDVPPCCEFKGRKRGLRRKLCRSFSFWSFSQPSARSFTLGSPFHFGLGLVWFGLEDDFDRITFKIWMHVVPRLSFFAIVYQPFYPIIIIFDCIWRRNTKIELKYLLNLCPGKRDQQQYIKILSISSPPFEFPSSLGCLSRTQRSHCGLTGCLQSPSFLGGEWLCNHHPEAFGTHAWWRQWSVWQDSTFLTRKESL